VKDSSIILGNGGIRILDSGRCNLKKKKKKKSWLVKELNKANFSQVLPLLEGWLMGRPSSR
jgi:hypothetical protein